MMDLPIPQPRRHEVRVKVHASTINIDDQHFAEGTMLGGVPVAPRPTADKPWVPGTDVVGTIDAVGEKVRGLEIGQTVFGIRAPFSAGPWAEYSIVKASAVSPVPAEWTTAEIASLGLSGMMVCSILSAMGEHVGRKCVVVGASGSIGTLLVPALAAAGATVWGVCSGRNAELVRGLGAVRVLDYQIQPYGDQIAASESLADVVIDLVGGEDTEAQGRVALSRAGTFLTIVGPEKHIGETKLGFWRVAAMTCRVAWRSFVSLFRGPKYRMVGPLAPDFDAIDRWIVSKQIRPTVDRIVPFTEAAVRDAIQYVASHRARGKVVIRMQ